MSRSPERISSYRRHFEDSSSSTYQVRVSSPSPTRREARHASAGYSSKAMGSSMRMESAGRRTVSAARRSRMVGSGVSAGAMVCVGPTGQPAIDLDVAAAENQEFLSTRRSEKQEMIVLNDRLAVYIDKVRSLEQQNKLLEAEIEAYQNRFEKPTGLRLLYEEQLKELKKIADQMKVQRDFSLAAKESTAAQLEAIKIKYEEAVELRKKAELDIEAFRPDVDKATSSRIALEKKLEQMEVEIEFLKRIHQQEIDELMKQIYAAHATAESAFTMPDLAAALKQIQTQYDDIAAKNLQEMDSWYKNKFENLTQKTSRHVDKVRSFREEIAGAKKEIQSKERDLESLRTKNEALEAQIRETQQKYRKELEDLQARIEALQLELKSTKEKIALHLREYQDLLNMKMALEIEITTYRKLIEGEDLRLSGMMQTLSLTSCSMSAIGSGMSFSGGGMGGVGGVNVGHMGASSGGVGGMVSGVGMSGGIAAGAIGLGAGGPGGTIVHGTNDNKGLAGRAGGVDVTGGHGLGAGGKSGGLGASAEGGGTGSGREGMSPDSAAGGVGSGAGSGGITAGGVGNLGFSAGGKHDSSVVGAGMGAGDATAGSGGIGGTGTGLGGIGGTGTGLGSTGGTGTGIGRPGNVSGGIGGTDTASGSTASGGIGGTTSGDIGGTGTTSGGIGGPGTTSGGIGGTGTTSGGIGGTGTTSGGIGGTGTASDGMGIGFSGGHGGVGEGQGNGVGAGIGGDRSKARGMGPAGMGSGIGGSGGTGDTGRNDVDDALSGAGGMGKNGGGKIDTSGAGTGYRSDGYDSNTEAYTEQAVELTERRTVLIRTVKNEDDVLETDHQEQTYTITGAADDSDDDYAA